MGFQKLFLPMISIMVLHLFAAVLGMESTTDVTLADLNLNDKFELREGDIVRIQNLLSDKGKLLNEEIGEIISKEENYRWGVQIKGNEAPISFNELKLKKVQNTVEEILEHEEKSKSRLLNKFNALNKDPKIRIGEVSDCRMTAFQLMDYFLGKQASEMLIKNYIETNTFREKWIDQTKIENSLKNELLKIETKSGRKFFVIQFFPRIEEFDKTIEMKQRFVANKWCFGQNLSGIVHMIFIEKWTKNAGMESQFRIFQSWANEYAYDVKLWLNADKINTNCKDEFNREFFRESRENFGKGKYLNQVEITKFIENIMLFNKHNKEMKDEAKCMAYLNYVESLIDDRSLLDVLRQPEDIIDYYVKNCENKESAEILGKAAEAQRNIMAWYFPDLIWYPETFLMYYIYE